MTSTTRVTRHIVAPPGAVYHALTDATAVRQWMVPDGMTSEVHEFDAREGGRFRISLTYVDAGVAGKTGGGTDTFHGRFARLVPDREVVQVVEFETGEAKLRGEMTITYTLLAKDHGTEVIGVHEALPEGIRPEDNELGWRMSLAKLARLVEPTE